MNLDKQFKHLNLYMDFYIEKITKHAQYINKNPKNFKKELESIRQITPKFQYPFEPDEFEICKLDGYYKFNHYDFTSFNFRKIK